MSIRSRIGKENALQLIENAQNPKLTNLDLSGLGLRELPAEIGNNTTLSRLDLSGNELKELPTAIGNLSALTFLDLRNNRLEKVSPEIGKLTKLWGLCLQNNKLTRLPSEIGQLTSLTRLDLEGNQLEALPVEIENLTNLTLLDLRRNQLATLPAVVGRLTHLKGLYLLDNLLTVLPASIGNLTTLTRLDLEGNQLTALPVDIGRLVNLTLLNLRRNCLKALPAEIGRLDSLNELDLQHNHLATLPAEIAHLTKLARLDLDRNPWSETYISLISQGKKQLFTFLRSLLEEGESQYEAKLILVGEGNVGKTSLVANLMGEGFQENRSTTHGIVIKRLMLPHPDPHIAANIVLNIWDFGGQEIYRVTHQFFFTRRSLYLMVWNPREGVEQSEIEDWLSRIKLSVPDTKVLMVATHCNDRQADAGLNYLKSKFGDMISGSLEVDNLDGTGIKALRGEITRLAALLPQMGEPLNTRWAAARESLLALRHDHPYVNRKQMETCFRENGLTEEEIPVLAALLQDLGHIIHFPEYDGLRELVILQPEWLTKAISYVFEDRETAAQGGILEHKRLKAIWFDHGINGRDRYETIFHPYFLRMMEAFDICYRFDGGNKSLVTQMVPHEPPADAWLNGSESSLKLLCGMQGSPPGLIPWLTVRNYRFSLGKHWQKGVLLEHQAHRALIRLTDDRKLEIEVRGQSPSHFMSLLRDSLEYLVEQRWPGLEYKLTVPCPTLEAGKPCRGEFPLEGLQKNQAKGRTIFPCIECGEDHAIARLLTGFSYATTEGTNLAALSAQVRTLTRITISESREGPRLFTLQPEENTSFDLSKLAHMGSMEFALTLWCEHPGHWHPLDPEGTYEFRRAAEWLEKAAPYIGVAAKVLRTAMAALVPGAGLLLDPDAAKALNNQLELMSRISGAVLLGDMAPVENIESFSPDLCPAEGAGLRAFHQLLYQVDPARKWGNLRRIVDRQAGDILWVCPEHYRHYDRGLPDLS